MSQQASSDSGKGNRGLFSGHIGFILAVAGSAVGLGNIWRFPYLAAKYGGGIFLLVYIILMLTFGYALIVAETSLGRKTRLSPVGAYRAFGQMKSNPFLVFGGWVNAVVPMLILPYYCLIGGWIIKFLFEYVVGQVDAVAADGYFGGFISSTWEPVLWHLIFLGCTLGIILKGVEGGVERAAQDGGGAPGSREVHLCDHRSASGSWQGSTAPIPSAPPSRRTSGKELLR